MTFQTQFSLDSTKLENSKKKSHFMDVWDVKVNLFHQRNRNSKTYYKHKIVDDYQYRDNVFINAI